MFIFHFILQIKGKNLIDKFFPSIRKYQGTSLSENFIYRLKTLIFTFDTKQQIYLLNLVPSKYPSRAQFHQGSTCSFYTCRSQKCKKILTTQLYFLHFRDLSAQNVDEIDTRIMFCNFLNQCFSTFLLILLNLDTQNCADLRILTESSK